jgi:hypothetical protein
MLLAGTLGLTEVVWIGPENGQVYVGSPSIWRTSNGSCIASHDFFGFTTNNNTVQVFADHTGGPCVGPTARWSYVGNVSGMYWANLFVPPETDADADADAIGSIYLIGVDSGDDYAGRSIAITRSDDFGASWSVPTHLFAGKGSTLEDPNSTSYHCAPTPTLVAADGRLYRSYEVTANGVSGGSVTIRTTLPYHPLSSNLLDPSVWEMSTVAPFPPKPHDWDPHVHFVWEEGNAVEGPNGDEIFTILRIDGQNNITYLSLLFFVRCLELNPSISMQMFPSQQALHSRPCSLASKRCIAQCS